MQRKKRRPKMGVERIARTTHPRSAQTYRRLCYFSAVAGGSPCITMAARCMDVIRGLSQILRVPNAARNSHEVLGVRSGRRRGSRGHDAGQAGVLDVILGSGDALRPSGSASVTAAICRTRGRRTPICSARVSVYRSDARNERRGEEGRGAFNRALSPWNAVR